MVSLPIPGQSRWRFPDPATAGEDGLVGIGADLAPATLVDAYRQGIFPWPHPGAPLPWFSPDPRGVIPLDGVAVSRSLRARLRRSGWETTVDRAFAAVLAGCADRGGTWITPPMLAAYQRLHDLGHAHSLEVWDDGELAGGLTEAGGSLIDVQMVTPHLASLGARDLARAEFLDLLARVRDDQVRLAGDRLPVARLG